MADAFNLLQMYQDDDDEMVPESHLPDHVEVRDSDTQVGDGVDVDSKDIDPLDKFLPPPPQEKCSDELQEKINKFLAYKRQGKSFNVEVRNRKDYRNPDFLRHAVRYQDIDEIGSCFNKDVFDPHGYDDSDFYDAIEAAIIRERQANIVKSKAKLYTS
ncbi:uncharacterized protein LOC141602427 [Silene latifolia]|uniref:uncharacterized protein LOC141602427 n=1 Tax=Silene latifolia TaxID=37657 RepID=UPI003D773A50